MIKIEEYIKICKYGQLIEVVNSKTNAFKSKNQDEGIELINGKLQLFKIITMKDETKEKAISESVTDAQINAVVAAFAKENEPEKIDNINSIPAILNETRIITPQDIDAWKKMSVFDRILLFQKTPKELIKRRRGYLLPSSANKDKKDLTDNDFKMFSYIPANNLKQAANIAFLFEWSAVVESEKYFDSEVAVRGYFQVELNGKLYRRPCAGSCIKKGIMDWGDTLQGAISEMEKRGIYDFIYGDLRRKDDEN